MKRWVCWAILVVFCAVALFAAEPSNVTLRGHLHQEPGKPATLETSDHKLFKLSSDEATSKVLADKRLNDADLEVVGHFNGVDAFEINPIHLPSLFTYRNGKRMQISYWCDVCYIRTASPGKCWCCQKETDLDPVEPEH